MTGQEEAHELKREQAVLLEHIGRLEAELAALKAKPVDNQPAFPDLQTR